MSDLDRYIGDLKRQIKRHRDALELNRANYYEVLLSKALDTKRGVDQMAKARPQANLLEVSK